MDGLNTAGSGDVEELSASTTKTMLSLDNVENTALSTWAGTANITTVGTVTSGTINTTLTAARVLTGLDGATVSPATIDVDDKVLIRDTSASDATKTVTTQAIRDLSSSVETVTGHVTVGGNSTASGYIEFLEDTDNGSNKITLTPPAAFVSQRTSWVMMPSVS